MSSYATLRTCAIGMGHHLGWSSSSFGGSYYCPKHLRELWASYNPQPGHPTKNRVRFINAPAFDPVPGVEGEWIVTAREADMITVSRLGFPDVCVQVDMSLCYPASYPFETATRGCGR